MKIPELYLFSGLGADERAFSGLDLSGYSVRYMSWIKPEDQETIPSYATRMAREIISDNPVLIGLSFGGMVAMEVAKQIPGAIVILISSAKTKREIPPYFRGYLNRFLLRLLPGRLLVWPNAVTFWLFGVTTQEEKKLLAAILKDTDPDFLKWALSQILQWKNDVPAGQVYHIHGKRDRLLPYRYIDQPVPVHNGGHLMIVSHAGIVSDIIREILAQEHRAD